MKFENILSNLNLDFNSLKALLISGVVLIIAILCGLLVSLIIRIILKKLDDKIEPDKTNILLDTRRWSQPLNVLLPALSIGIVFPILDLSDTALIIIRHMLSILTISAVAFLGIRIIGAVKDMILSQFDVNAKDNLQARTAHTQFRVIERIMIFGVIIIAAASILVTFEKVRQVGVSLLASAGIAGVILGFAAQRSISTVIAGIQIAITQPIRLDDVVIVENEWGWIEEITLTYVVVRIWDLRRLVLPITYFIERPFQNWTRTSADILGTIFLYTDYTVPVEKIKEELQRICEASPLWDRKVCGLQVTNASEKTMEVRALVSTKDSSKGWDLRCLVREKLIEFLQNNYPECLPKVRFEMKKEETEV